ncbi:MAG: thiol oxidoreductase [Cyclobacteriaceae bacterium]|nr:thiol oxidoreductase [Phycisphaeraceae bacterium]MBV6642798.1 thiol oxidoreductase [Cyclobacteriaceae bacterium SS2]
MSKIIRHLVIIVLIMSNSCEEIIPPAPTENELLDGPTTGLSHAEQRQFLDGDIAFNDEVFSSLDGLGPGFVATSCGSCHAGDGKGHPFTTLTRFGQTLPNTSPDLSIGGPQLQNRAIPGFEPEKIPDGVPSMKFTPPAVTGLGFLAALTDQQILQYVDSLDVDGDGISGVPNYITPPAYFEQKSIHQPVNGKIIGRFGKKAAAIDLLQQTVSAYNQDMGVTSTFEPIDPFSQLSTDPEVSDQTIRDVVFYLRTLKAPISRSEENSQVLHGKATFTEIGCVSCHIPEWTTPETDIKALSNKTFYPYTDLLLHDMGPGLDDGATEGSAETYEWRTPPLWGLGLAPNSQGGSYFLMHDGRARSIEEAIVMHGGEAENSKNQFVSLSVSDKEALIAFLESL